MRGKTVKGRKRGGNKQANEEIQSSLKVARGDGISNVNNMEVEQNLERNGLVKQISQSTTSRKGNKIKGRSKAVSNERENSVEFVEENHLTRMSMEGDEADFESDNEDEDLNKLTEFGKDSDPAVSFVKQGGHRGRIKKGKKMEKCRIEDSDLLDGELPSDGNDLMLDHLITYDDGRDDEERDQGLEMEEETEIDNNPTNEEIIGKAVGQALNSVKDMLKRSGIFETMELMKKHMATQREILQEKLKKDKGRQEKCTISYGGKASKGSMQDHSLENTTMPSNSELTIYHNALIYGTATVSKVNTSSEEEIATSDESHDIVLTNESRMSTSLDNIDKFIAEYRRRSEQLEVRETNESQPRPSTSREGVNRLENSQQAQIPLTADHRAQQMIQQAEASRARIFKAQGELSDKVDSNRFECKLNSELVHSVMVDENYLMVGSHVDDNTKLKIITRQYVELEKLLVRDILVENEDQRMQIVNRGNQTFWVPIKEIQHIHNFGKWEQAFRVFTNIYVKKFPQRSSELIQYYHLIHTASLSYVWDNVYSYDKDFWLHLSHFPSCSWSIIL